MTTLRSRQQEYTTFRVLRFLGVIYVLTPQGLAQKALLTGRFLQRKLQEYEQLQQEISQLQAEAAVLTSPESEDTTLNAA